MCIRDSNNGTLRTSTPFDFETDNLQYRIKVKVEDQYSATATATFILNLLDMDEPGEKPTDQNSTSPNTPETSEQFRPILKTREAHKITLNSATLRAMLIDDGNSSITERGFQLSDRPFKRYASEGATQIVSEDSSNAFQFLAEDLQPNHKYFFRPYATNAVGTSYGSVESFKTLRNEQKVGPSWINAQPAKQNNWWITPWFGTFYAPDNRGWIMHRDLGWLFALKQPERAVWLWNENLGWIWTHPDHFPFLYSNQLGNWMFFYGQRNGRLLFYDYGANRWMINF